MKHLQVEQVHALIRAAKTDRDKLLFALLFQHGMRISEALALTKGSVQRGGYLRVRAKKRGKHSDEKMNPQTLALWQAVTAHILPTTFVFPVSRQWCSQLFHRACEAAGIELQPRQGLHSLRHSLGHAMLASGSPLPVIQKALRHRSLSSTSCYLEADAADTDRWRATAIMGGACDQAAAQAIAHELPPSAQAQTQPTMTLAGIQEEIARLNRLALTLQGGAMKNAHGIGGIR